ncbi:MAG: multicopper oxidase domain-containing protein [Crocinitomicaceae bacterium]|nr:multicopper oxidase domain-containing protein [Crocinitomicaceae bacterium]MDG1776286.1 multicopper oxidase domain-containing protein [Crocinitomicaceae bacterium]
MRNNSILTLVLSIILSFSIEAQIDVVQNIFSKMDIAPQHTLWDGSQTMLMGYTKLMGAAIDIPGPTLNYIEGDSIELKLRNMSQGASHTIHLHGLDVDQQNDGVPHLSFEVGHNETKSYFFKAPHPGTYLYHCHVTSTLHVQAGMYGLLIVRPSSSNLTWNGGHHFHQEKAWMTSELDTIWHSDSIINQPHDTTTNQVLLPDYNPQYFFINGRSENQLSSQTISASVDENILLRLANIGFYGNKYVFPYQLGAKVISSDGRPFPIEEITDTLVVLPGERYQVLFEPEIEFSDYISVSYFDLNTMQDLNTQNVSIDVQGFLSLPELNISGFEAYPNPVTNVLHLKNVQKEHVQILDASGKHICFIKNTGSVDVSRLQKGVYFLKGKKKTVKFIKQ